MLPTHIIQNSCVRTRALGSAVFAKIQAAEGLFYPSTFDQIGTNLVVKSRTFETKFHATSSRVIRIERKRRFGFYDSTNVRHACGVGIDAAFEWLAPSEKHDHIIFNMTHAEEQFCRQIGIRLRRTLTHSSFHWLVCLSAPAEDLGDTRRNYSIRSAIAHRSYANERRLASRRQVDRRDHTACAPASKFNGRQFNRYQSGVTAQCFALFLSQRSSGAGGKYQQFLATFIV